MIISKPDTMGNAHMGVKYADPNSPVLLANRALCLHGEIE